MVCSGSKFCAVPGGYDDDQSKFSTSCLFLVTCFQYLSLSGYLRVTVAL
jgi:hypothetical protein